MGLPRQEYCSGLPFPSVGIFPRDWEDWGLLQCRQILLPPEPPGKPITQNILAFTFVYKTKWVHMNEGYFQNIFFHVTKEKSNTCNLLFINTMKVEVSQSCLTLCNPMDCSPPGYSVRGILQSRILEWVTVSFSRGSSQPRDWSQVCRTAGEFITIWTSKEAH